MEDGARDPPVPAGPGAIAAAAAGALHQGREGDGQVLVAAVTAAPERPGAGRVERQEHPEDHRRVP